MHKSGPRIWSKSASGPCSVESVSRGIAVAFSPATLAAPVTAGSSISIGVVAGVSLMVAGLGLTAIYALYASLRLDRLAAALREELP